jgi:hypothetical protein
MASGDKMESAKNKKSDLGVLGDNPDLSGVSAMPPPVYEKGLGDGSGSIPVPQFRPEGGAWEDEGAPNDDDDNVYLDKLQRKLNLLST